MTQYLLLAKANRTLDGKGALDDLLQLGRYELHDDGTAEFIATNYDAKKNLQPLDSTVRHPLYFPNTHPGFIQIPHPYSSTNVPGTWTLANGLLRVVVGQTAHEWTQTPGDPELWQPANPNRNATDGSFVIAGVTQKECRGYAVFSDVPTLSAPVPRSALADYYAGEEQTLIASATSWIRQGTGWHVTWFTYGSGNVLGYKAFDPNTRGGLWKFSTFMLNYAPDKAALFSSGGFNYSHSLTTTDPMHAFGYLMKVVGGKVTRIIGIQYFAQLLHPGQTHPWPICSVIQYRAP